ncbi:Veg family protein [Peptoniphilus equinus]|uniref:Veg family protein n=1 Tax=Peptoniphilus equinus TaxID=3016343 RepID=A0ABY7QW10_9FIRM|nr:Veg family protein [Peptoniphilus equinus]WBW50230.1 Veg family protein [Peptoniphilus equinus]
MNQMNSIKNELQANLGKKVIIRANKGRKKFVTRRGRLDSVYPSLFSVSVENGNDITTATFTYSDVLTGTVRVTILEDDVEFSDVTKRTQKIS